MSRQTDLKRTLASVLSGMVPNLGVLDTERMDPDALPREARPGAGYWALSVEGFADRAAGMGGGNTQRPTFRTYSLRLEGWRGFAAVSEVTDAWEEVVEKVGDVLTLWGTIPAELGRVGIRAVTNLRCSELGIVSPAGNSRFHHVLFRFDVETYVLLTR